MKAIMRKIAPVFTVRLAFLFLLTTASLLFFKANYKENKEKYEYREEGLNEEENEQDPAR